MSPLPFLSAYDPPHELEGSIDPLGLYAIADAIAVRLIPGVRERQIHPRYITLAAVGVEVCRGFDPEYIAADGRTPPWLVFEWYVVEGLVREADAQNLTGLPGNNKVRTAIESGEAICAATYLKTASVFGFHGIYRLLAEELAVYRDGLLLENGVDLLDAWEKDCGLSGFRAQNSSVAKQREILEKSVTDGLAKGRTDRGSKWSGWGFIAEHLLPNQCGTAERNRLWSLLVMDQKGYRGRVLQLLVSEPGRAIWKSQSERMFHKWLRKQADGEMRLLLDAAMAYETFSRLMIDAFDDCRCFMSNANGKVGVAELAELDLVKKASEDLPDAFHTAAHSLNACLPAQAKKFEEDFQAFSESMQGHVCAERIFKHHEEIQKRKPPNGKNPWFDKFDDDRRAIRPAYRLDSGGRGGDEYVHAYRTKSLWSFSHDLGRTEA